MRKMTKMLLCTMVFTMVFGVPAFAGSWELKSIRGWRYLQDDGSYAANGWSFINGVYYCFDEEGYMFAGEATPDGYFVGLDGAWLPGQAPADLSAGTYHAVQDVSYSNMWVPGIDEYQVSESLHSGEGLDLVLTAGSTSNSFRYLLDSGTGTLTKTAVGRYTAENAEDSEYTDYWVKSVSVSNDYIFVGTSGEGDGAWCDAIMFKK